MQVLPVCPLSVLNTWKTNGRNAYQLMLTSVQFVFGW